MNKTFKEGPGWYLIYVDYVETGGAMMSLAEASNNKNLIAKKLINDVSEKERMIEAKRLIGNEHDIFYIVFYEKKISSYPFALENF
ncbi:MAG: hypothetical protein WCT51_02090 [Candidatus Shapirobacteria bacterium]|jgi:hypothetical protein